MSGLKAEVGLYTNHVDIGWRVALDLYEGFNTKSRGCFQACKHLYLLNRFINICLHQSIYLKDFLFVIAAMK